MCPARGWPSLEITGELQMNPQGPRETPSWRGRAWQLPTPCRGFGVVGQRAWQRNPCRPGTQLGARVLLGTWEASHSELQPHASVCGESPPSFLLAFHRKMRASRCLFLLSGQIEGKSGLARITMHVIRNDMRDKEKLYFLGKYRAATSGSISVRSSR